MGTSNLRVLKDGDFIFRVDPQKLIIEKAQLRAVQNGYGKVCMCKSNEVEGSISIEKFPIEFQGVIFFKTQESAVDFIKTQIGI